MKFRRKAQGDADLDAADGGSDLDDLDEQSATEDSLAGPYDSDDLPHASEGERVDLGSLLILSLIHI